MLPKCIKLSKYSYSQIPACVGLNSPSHQSLKTKGDAIAWSQLGKGFTGATEKKVLGKCLAKTVIYVYETIKFIIIKKCAWTRHLDTCLLTDFPSTPDQAGGTSPAISTPVLKCLVGLVMGLSD